MSGPFANARKSTQAENGVVESTRAMVQQARVGGERRRRERIARWPGWRACPNAASRDPPVFGAAEKHGSGRLRDAKGFSVSGHQFAGEFGRCANGDLLSEHGANGQFEAVPRAGNTQAGTGGDQCGQSRIGGEMRSRLRPDPRPDRRCGASVRRWRIGPATCGNWILAR